VTYYPNPDTSLQNYLDQQQRTRLAEEALRRDKAAARASKPATIEVSP
jgi:hypothetical protein